MFPELPLDPGEYNGTYKAVGGALSLDFANLVSYRTTDHAHDWLVPAANLAVWAAEVADATVVNPSRWPPGTTDQLVDDASSLRELLSRVFTPLADRREPAKNDLVALADAAHTARGHQRLDFRPPRPTWNFPDDHPSACAFLDAITLDAARVLTDADLDRLRACSGCGWVFLDTSPGGRRRWCDPSDCGNRARQRRHYYRGRSAG